MTYIVIDAKEKRTLTGGFHTLDEFMATLSENPTTIGEFNSHYSRIAKEAFFDEGNKPKVPQELSLKEIRNVLGMFSQPRDELVKYWKQVSLYHGPNYQSWQPDEKTEFDIPELTPELMAEWESEDPEKEEFPTANDYRKFSCGDGIVVADLRKKEVKWISHGGFNLFRERPNEQDKEDRRKRGHDYVKQPYSLPAEWKLIEE